MLTTRTDIINYLIDTRNYTSYLEIGMDDPTVNFIKVKCPLKESVDPYDMDHRFCTAWSDENLNLFLKYLTYRMTSDDFFALYPQKKYDLIFIDGLHVEDQVDRDIRHALEHLNAGGTVVVHDCLPVSDDSQSEENPSGDWVGTVWRSIVKYSLYSPCDVKVIDTDWGVGIIEYCEDLNFKIPEHINIDFNLFNAEKYKFIHIYDWKQIRTADHCSKEKTRFYPEKLRLITDALLSNFRSMQGIGFLNGLTGAAFYLFYLSKTIGDKDFENIANKLCNAVINNINNPSALNFTNGLSGIGWAMNHLICQGFMPVQSDDALDDFDRIAARCLEKKPVDVKLTTSMLLYATSRLSAPEKYIKKATKETLCKAVVSELEYLTTNYKDSGFPIDHSELDDFDITWYYPWLLWSINRIAQSVPNSDLKTTLIQRLFSQANSIIRDEGIHPCNRFFLHLVILNGKHDSFFEMPSSLWESVAHPSVKNGLAGIMLLIKLFPNDSQYSELKQKLSNRLSIYEDLHNPAGHLWASSSEKDCFGLLNGITGIGLSELL